MIEVVVRSRVLNAKRHKAYLFEVLAYMRVQVPQVTRDSRERLSGRKSYLIVKELDNHSRAF